MEIQNKQSNKELILDGNASCLTRGPSGTANLIMYTMKKLESKLMMLAVFSTMVMSSNLTCAQTFTKVTTGPVATTPADSRSVNWVDVNNDALIDLFISNGKAGGQNNMLYLNAGGGNFTQVTSDPIVTDNKPSDGATFADTDNDGDLDAFVANWYNESNLFYTNNGNGIFTQLTAVPVVTSGGYSESASWGDYDNDGLLDLYVARSGATSLLRRNQLFHNDGGNAFTKILTGTPVTHAFISRSVNWTDIDGDGDLDLFVGNEGTTNNNENCYRNDGAGVFTSLTTGALLTNGGSTMSSSWGDYDNDGDLDVYLANDGTDNALFRNDGNFNFTKITGDPVTQTNSHSFSSAWSDIDNDGDLDLFVTNSYNPIATELNNFLYLNNGDGSFSKVLTGAPATDLSWSYGCAFGDYDNDGFEDLAVATVTFGGADKNDFLYHNDGNSNHWITIKLVGTTTNKAAIGTKIRLNATINGVSVTQLREISAQSSYCGQNDLRAHFGLGDATVVNSIVVQWLSGTEETYTNIGGSQFITIIEGQGILKVGSIEENPNDIKIYPNPANDFLNIQSKNPIEIASINIYNALGQFAMTSASNENGVDVSDLSAGIYFVKISSDQGTFNSKFVKN
jgi:hypothetical protein